MTDFHDPDTRNLLRMLRAVASGSATRELHTQIMQMLDRSPNLIPVYIRYTYMLTALIGMCSGEEPRLPAILRRQQAQDRQNRKVAAWSAILTLALLIAVGGLSYAFMITPKDNSLHVEGFAGYIWLEHDTQWNGDRPTHASVAMGGHMSTTGGNILMQLSSGVRLGTQGQTSLHFVDRGVVKLDNGQIIAHVPPVAAGFMVKTPLMEIIDLGTKFITHVTPSGDEHLWVEEGAVEVFIRDQPLNLMAGQGVRVSLDGVPTMISQMDSSMRSMLALSEGIVETSGDVQFEPTVPTSLEKRSLASNEHVSLLVERNPMGHFQGDLIAGEMGVYSILTAKEHPMTLGEGQFRSYLLHADPRQHQRFRGSITFDQPIHAIACSQTALEASDSAAKQPETRFPALNQGNRSAILEHTADVETDPTGEEHLLISRDRRTITFSLKCSPQHLDQVRIICER